MDKPPVSAPQEPNLTAVGKLAAFSLNRPITVAMFFISLVTLGLISSRLLLLEEWPEIKVPFFSVSVPYQSATPQEVEQSITRPLEEALATLGDIQTMSSNSGTYGATVNLHFNGDVDTDEKGMLIKEQVDLLRPSLPQGVRHIEVDKAETGEESFMELRITSDMDLKNAYDLLNRHLVKPLQRLPGVAKVKLLGIEPLELRIKLDNERMKRYGIGFNELQSRLQEVNFHTTSGNFLTADQAIRITPKTSATGIDDYRELLLNKNNIRLKDIAEVEIVNGDRDYARHLNRKYSVGLEIYKESTANLVQVADAVVNEIENIGKTPQLQGIKLIYFNNQADSVKQALNNVVSAGIGGFFLSLVVLWVFLRNLSMTLMISLSIPISVIITLGVMLFKEISLNNMSLMGLMVAIGMLVDNSVVISESIFTQRQKHPQHRRKAIIEGLQQVMTPVMAGTLTSICVFFTIIVNEYNLLSVFLSHFAVVIIAALLVSLFIAISVIPMFTYHFGSQQPSDHAGKNNRQTLWQRLNKKQQLLLLSLAVTCGYLLSTALGLPTDSIRVFIYVAAFFIIMFGLYQNYQTILDFTLRHRWLTMFFIIGLLTVGLFAKGLIREEDGAGQSIDRDFWLPYHVKESYSLEKLKQDVDRIENYLYQNQQQFEIDSVYSYYSENGEAISKITLIPEQQAKKSVRQIKQEIMENLPKIATGNPSFRWRSQIGNQEISVYLQGDSTEVIKKDYLPAVKLALQNIPQITHVEQKNRNQRQELQVTVDRERALNFGLDPRQVAQSVNIAMQGLYLKDFVAETGEIPVRMRFYQKGEFELQQLQELPIKNNAGQSIPLQNIATIKTTASPQGLFRMSGESTVKLTISAADGAAESEIKAAIKQKLDKINFHSGYRWSFESGRNSFNIRLDDLTPSLIVAVLMIFVIMAAMFESLLFPLCVINSVIFSFIGTWVMFAFTGTTFNIMAGIGMLILLGITVNNGIVLIDRIRKLREQGHDRHTAVLQGGKDRLRPILMTVSTTIVGLIPLSISTSGIGDEAAYFPMARAIIGGLSFSTVVSLLVLPSLYCWLDDLRIWSKQRTNLNLLKQGLKRSV